MIKHIGKSEKIIKCTVKGIVLRNYKKTEKKHKVLDSQQEFFTISIKSLKNILYCNISFPLKTAPLSKAR